MDESYFDCSLVVFRVHGWETCCFFLPEFCDIAQGRPLAESREQTADADVKPAETDELLAALQASKQDSPDILNVDGVCVFPGRIEAASAYQFGASKMAETLVFEVTIRLPFGGLARDQQRDL